MTNDPRDIDIDVYGDDYDAEQGPADRASDGLSDPHEQRTVALLDEAMEDLWDDMNEAEIEAEIYESAFLSDGLNEDDLGYGLSVHLIS